MYVNIMVCAVAANRDLPVKPGKVARSPKLFTLRQTLWASRARFAELHAPSTIRVVSGGYEITRLSLGIPLY